MKRKNIEDKKEEDRRIEGEVDSKVIEGKEIKSRIKLVMMRRSKIVRRKKIGGNIKEMLGRNMEERGNDERK